MRNTVVLIIAKLVRTMLLVGNLSQVSSSNSSIVIFVLLSLERTVFLLVTNFGDWLTATLVTRFSSVVQSQTDQALYKLFWNRVKVKMQLKCKSVQ